MQTLGAALRQMQAECDTRNTRLIGHHDLDGSGDGMQVIKYGQFAYVAHVGKSKMALSILDVSDPANPRLLRQIAHPPNTHNHKVQIVGNTLIQNSEYISYLAKTGPEDPVTGLNVYNIDDPTDPKLVGFYPVGMRGVHRIWYREPPYAHIAAPVGATRGYHIVDLSVPTEPRMAGCWWPPGAKQDDADPWKVLDPAHNKFQVHGAIPNGNRAYVSCTDAGVALLDITDASAPELISRVNWCPPYGGYAHTALPLPGRGLLIALCEYSPGGRERNGDKRIWVIDIREERQPVIIASFPEPKPGKNSPWQSFHDRPVRFGPHNLHENYPNGFQSERLIFSTWFSGGMRVTNISDPDRPVEVGHFLPPPPPGEEAPEINDLFVDRDRLIYLTDRRRGGLYVVEYTGEI